MTPMTFDDGYVCPCGLPECKPDDAEAPAHVLFEEWGDAGPPPPEPSVLVPHDVYQERHGRMMRVAQKGQRVPAARARELGLLPVESAGPAPTSAT